MKKRKAKALGIPAKSAPALHDRQWLQKIIIVAFAFVLYGNTIPNDYSLDDNLVVYKHPLVEQGIKSIPEIFTSHYRQAENNEYGYRPIAMTTFAIENQFFGQNPQLSHFINILLYALLLLILLKLLTKLFQGVPRRILLFIVLLFAAHPLHTEVVASLKNREEILCFIFGAIAIILSIRFYHTVKLKMKIMLAVLAIISIIISVFSKQTGLFFCFMIPLMLLQFYLKPIKSLKGLWTEKTQLRKYLIFMCLSLLLIIFGYVIYKVPDVALPSENKPVFGFENPLFDDYHIQYRFSLAFISLLYYMKLIFIPYPLCFYYGYDMVPLKDWYDIRILFSLIFHAAVMIFAVLNFYKQKIFSFGILFYLLGIVMFTNWFLPIPGIIGERLVFVSSFGFCIVLGYGVYFFTSRKNIRTKPNAPGTRSYVLYILILLTYSAVTIARNPSWKNLYTLYSADIDKLENSAKANCMMADELMRKAYIMQESGNADVTINNDVENALGYYEKAVAIYPRYASVYNNIGTIFFNFKKDFAAAVIPLRKAVLIDTTYREAEYNLALSYAMLNEKDSAFYYYGRAYRLDSFNVSLLSEYAALAAEMKNFDRAVTLNKKWMMLDTASDLPYINIGNIFLMQGDTLNAVDQWEIALRKTPENKELCYNLYMYFKAKGIKTKEEFYKTKLK